MIDQIDMTFSIKLLPKKTTNATAAMNRIEFEELRQADISARSLPAAGGHHRQHQQQQGVVADFEQHRRRGR